MKRYLFVRLVQSIITLLILSVVIFGLVRISGDPALLMLDESATRQDYEIIRKQMGLDKPVYVQYGIFLANALQGDFGNSVRSKRPVINSIIEAYPNTVKLAFASVFIGLLFSIPMGVLGAVKKGTFLDTMVRIAAGVAQSVPMFWVGIMMISIFVIELELLPSSGMGTWRNYVMPASCLGIFLMAGITRLLRSSMLEVLDSDFIRMARIKGVSSSSIIWKHALRNSLLPVVSFGGMYIAILMTGAILIETVFAWPGFGRLAYMAVVNQDFPLIQGVVLTAGATVMVANLITDIFYAYLDPRIRIKA